MITMLLGGLWHGAAWTFVAWGFFHGVIIIATHWLGNLRIFAGFIASNSKLVRMLKWSITFYLILIGWVLFRAHSIDSAIDIIGDMHGFGNLPEASSVAFRVTAITMLAVIYMHLQDWFVIARGEAFEQKKWVFWPVLVLLQAICLFVGAPSNEFIYFQF